jgi:DNA-binding CsgD family transcriptional regulator
VDCLRWAANGKTDGEIAEILSIARWTVVTYLQNAKIKLNCSNRTSAVATAAVAWHHRNAGSPPSELTLPVLEHVAENWEPVFAQDMLKNKHLKRVPECD